VFHALNQKLLMEREMQASALEGAVSGFKSSMLEAITPGRKRKERFEELKLGATLMFTPGKRSSTASSMDSLDDELIIIPLEDSQDNAPGERLERILGQ
jgi:hypothetical protein